MAIVSLELSDALSVQVAMAADELGISPGAFMVRAIRRATETVEQRRQFVAEAQIARVAMLQSGQGHDANEVRAYLRARLVDPASPRPGIKSSRE
jgi:predicted transcriptional regulator